MATRTERSESFKKAFLLKGVPFLKAVYATCKDGYNDINVVELTKKFNVPTESVAAMVNVEILSRNGKTKTAKFHWKDSRASEFTQGQWTNMAEKVWNKMNLDKKVYKANKKITNDFNKKKNLVPIIGTKRPVSEPKPLDSYSAAILAAMKSIYEHTKDGNLVSRTAIFDIASPAITALYPGQNTSDETIRTAITLPIVDALINNNYLRPHSIAVSNIYTWKEEAPTAEHALSLKALMKESGVKIKIDESKETRILGFLKFLSTLKDYTEVKMQAKLKEFGLNSNEQVIITKHVLDFTGEKSRRKYKYKLTVHPTPEFASEILVKIREYGNLFNKSKNKSKESGEAFASHKLPETIKIKTPSKESDINKMLESLKKRNDEVNESIRKLISEQSDIAEKIIEGESILSLKEKELAFVASCSKYVTSSNVELAVNNSQRSFTKSQLILNLLAERGTVPFSELVEHFYPGQGLTYKTAKVKALSALISFLKKGGRLIAPKLGEYSLPKK